jgi:GNAT superfamily N-acetyltransferase
VGKKHRRQGIQTALIDAAVEYARSRGASAVEAYPIEPSADLQSYAGYTGIRSSFLRAGFEEVRRLEERWTVMRKVLS